MLFYSNTKLKALCTYQITSCINKKIMTIWFDSNAWATFQLYILLLLLKLLIIFKIYYTFLGAIML